MQMRSRLSALLLLTALSAAGPAVAEKQYDTGASDTAIKIGNTMAYSGPASAYGTLGKADAAYFDMINDRGGVNGRKIEFISLDDAFQPNKTVEQTRRLVERDGVLLMFNALGTAPNTAVMKYLNGKKVPQLFIGAAGAKFADPENFPWTMSFQPNAVVEGRIYANYIQRNHPEAKVAILYQDDDLGRDYLKGLREGFGDKADEKLVGVASYQLTDPTVDSQIVALKASGADILVHASTPKFAAQALRKVAELDWDPLQIMTVGVTSVSAVLKPAGPENATGVIGATYFKDPTDPKWADDPGYLAWRDWMAKYYADGDASDVLNVLGYNFSETMVQVLKQAGDNLTRENVMKEALNLDFQPSMMLPGVRVKTAPDKYTPVTSMQMQRFNGKSWELFGDVITQ